ncbi:MAG: glycerophosphodiester phosphodiesterase family protein [Clostridia bacterium]|nr:glycerophosphodiester phosphodiesterase family protein [Clostridia bacterium]MBO4886635.1 glycerophosphodiester phosphodiesterase family protein [Clostridia bacterium]
MFDLREMCKDKVLVAAHRGTWMGNIPCNTIMAFNAALKAGADIVELDVSRSLSGTLYVFHPGTEPHYLHSEKLIADMNDEEVQALRLVNTDDAVTQYPVPLFDDALEELKGRCMINVDKFFMYPEDIIRAIRRHGMADQVLVKSNQEERFFDMVEQLAPDFAYMTFARDEDHASERLVKRKMNYLGAEALFRTEQSEFATPAYHEKMHRMGLLTWANAIVFNYKTVHSAGHTDDLYTMDRADDGWGYLARLGYNMIQTDWVAPCVAYLKENGWRG